MESMQTTTEETQGIGPTTFSDTSVCLMSNFALTHSANVGLVIFFAPCDEPAEGLDGAQECGWTRIQFLSDCVCVCYIGVMVLCFWVCVSRRVSDGHSCCEIKTSVVSWQARPRVRPYNTHTCYTTLRPVGSLLLHWHRHCQTTRVWIYGHEHFLWSNIQRERKRFLHSQ